MKKIWYILLWVLLLNCDSGSVSETQTAIPIKGEIKKDTEKPIIIFNPKYTFEEWIHSIWIDYYNESPELLNYIRLKPDNEDEFDIFFIIQGNDKISYYTLIKKDNNEYDLNKLDVSANSVLSLYGSSAYSTVNFYNLSIEDVDGNGQNELLVATEINGMTEATDGDGIQPFNKIQFDVLSINKQAIEHNSQLTDSYNKQHDIEINKDSYLPLNVLLSQKYNESITTDYQHEKMAQLFQDMEITSSSHTNLANEFNAVLKNENEEYYVDKDYLSPSYFFVVNNDNDFNIKGVSATDYPLLRISSYEVYTFKITNIRVDSDQIKLLLENVLEPENEENIEVFFYYENKKWVLYHASDYFMMNKDKSELNVISY